jgi:hypothetical protein
MIRSLGTLFLAALVPILASTSALAQTGSGTSSLSGIVADSAGGVVPGASVVVTNTATGVKRSFITNSAGAFSAPALDVGTYSITVSLQGFKTAVVNNVVLEVGSPRSVPITLEVGNLTETIEVRAGSELIQTQSTAVTSTINATQIQNLPLTSRNALFGFVIMLPGVDTPTTPRDSQMFGLPEQAINITIDGINTNNNFQRDTDGFYSMVFPQLDAVEQVTVTGAAAGSDSAGGGSVAIRFVTRSGTNSFRGTSYYYLRHPKFNTNYYFNEQQGLPKNRLILNQFGGSVGGPIVLPRLYDGRGKAFYFFNYEEFYQPTSATRTRTLLHPTTASGVFRYNVTQGGVTTTREVNLFDLARQNGQTDTWDPTVQALLAQVRSLAEASVADGTGKINDQNNVNHQQFVYLAPGKYVNHLPTGKVDFNLSPQHRLSSSYWWQNVSRFPDIQNNGEATFPGLPNKANYQSIRTVGSVSMRSTLSSALVNELVGGWQWGPGTFNAGVVASQFDNQAGFSIGFPNLNTLAPTSATRSTNPNTRYQSNWNITDTVNWLKGNHTISFGGSFSQVIQRNTAQNVVPTIGIGIQSGLDPADSMFSTSNFQGASNTNLAEARALYAFLTGRVTSVNAQARQDAQTNRYVYLGREEIRGSIDEWSAFFQDSWRMKPTFTINYGLAYLAQMPMKAGNDVYSTTDYAGFCGPYGIAANGQCKLFQVGGEQTGVHPQFVQYTADTPGYNTDWNNLAPNLGVAWRPNVQNGWLRRVLGDPEQATVRAGYSVTFDKPSMGDFTGLYGNNPGRNYNANRNNNTGAAHLLVNPGESWPVLFRDSSRLGPPSGIPEGPSYPIQATTGTELALFDPNLEVPYTHSFSAGFQRSLTRDMAVEVRYVGTRGRKAWIDEDWNEMNLIENGFFNEFKLAQQNLRSHVLAGCGTPGNPSCSFAYRGPGTNTLPILLAYLNAQPFGNAGNQALYTGTAWTNTTLVGRLSVFEPEPFDMVEDLETNARIANAATAGLPSNFFRMNPAIGTNEANITRSVGESRYDSLVLELRRRFSRGLLLTTNYTRAWRWGQFQDSLHFPRQFIMSTNSVPHAVKITSNWDLPIGRGKRFGTDFNPWLEGILGNWTFNLIGRVQAGRVLTVTGARLVGMSQDELQDMYKIRIKEDGTVFMLPDDVILNTRRAYSSSSTSLSGYGALGAPEGKYIAPASTENCTQLFAGDCAPRNIFLHGPIFTRFDMSWKKTFPFSQRANFALEIDVLNIFDNINFNPAFDPGSGTIFDVTSAYTDISGTYDPGGRLGQIVWRVNW